MKNKYKNPLNLLILLGFICQGFSWENWLLPILFTGVWLLVLYFQRQKQVISDNLELLIFFLAIVISLKFIGSNTYFRLLAMGNALLLLQAMRMLSPMNRRKKLIALIIAITHLAVGSQFILDYSFILILIFAIILIPKSLYQVHSERYLELHSPPLFGRRMMFYPAVVVLMILFFMVFPRQKITSGKEAGMIMNQGPMRPRMDTVTGGDELSTKPVLRVKGENVEYLKKFALDTFDGDVWTASSASWVIGRRMDPIDREKAQYRHVTVMDLTLMGSTLPVDKNVQYINGNFYQGGHISRQGSIVITLVWPRNKNFYEYWTNDKCDEQLTNKWRKKYTTFPEQSARLKQWLNDRIKNEKDPAKQVKIIEQYLKQNFTYELGTPNLNRLEPIDDFIFNQKAGHCERFASALALFCRMLNIPSRVVIGYYVPPKNQFADYHNVQVNNGHAWVEAFLPGKGWATFDATPYSEQVQAEATPTFMLTIKDWIDFVWYSKIVEFSASDQNQLLSSIVGAVKYSISLAMKYFYLLVVILIVAITSYILGKIRFKLKNKKLTPKVKQAIQLEAAEKFYSDMLENLAKIDICRLASQTPNEFAFASSNALGNIQDDIKLITENFCLVKYGELPLSVKQVEATMAAVEKIKKECHEKKSEGYKVVRL